MRGSNIQATAKGFVPARQKLIHQVYLRQEYVDRFDEDALLVSLLDMEKEFDRCSWEFLKKSMKALGLGKDIRRWIAAPYDHERPPERKINMNGEKSYITSHWDWEWRRKGAHYPHCYFYLKENH